MNVQRPVSLLIPQSSHTFSSSSSLSQFGRWSLPWPVPSNLSKVSNFIGDKSVLEGQKIFSFIAFCHSKNCFFSSDNDLYLILVTLTKPDPDLQIGFLAWPQTWLIQLEPWTRVALWSGLSVQLGCHLQGCPACLAQVVQDCGMDSKAPALPTVTLLSSSSLRKYPAVAVACHT